MKHATHKGRSSLVLAQVRSFGQERSRVLKLTCLCAPKTGGALIVRLKLKPDSIPNLALCASSLPIVQRLHVHTYFADDCVIPALHPDHARESGQQSGRCQAWPTPSMSGRTDEPGNYCGPRFCRCHAPRLSKPSQSLAAPTAVQRFDAWCVFLRCRNQITPSIGKVRVP